MTIPEPGAPDADPGQWIDEDGTVHNDHEKRSPFPGDKGRNTGTLYGDVAALLDGGLPDPPEPVLLTRTDGNAIFYGGRVNWLYGDPESGKTLVALAAMAEGLMAGRCGVFIDIDHNGMEAIVCHLLDMGVPEDTLRSLDRFRYVEPEDRAQLAEVVDDLKLWRPAVAVVDSVGELMPLMGAGSNSADEFTSAHARVLKPLAVAGACVIVIDHMAKDPDSRNRGPTGTYAKKRVVGGAMIRVTVEEQFAPGQGGKAMLTISKDRHGGLRQNCPPAVGKEQVAGIFVIAPKADRISWTVQGPQPGDVPKADRVDPADLDALAALVPPPTSVRDVKARLKWASVRAARGLKAWRSQRSPGVPGEQGTGEPDGVPPFPPYVPGNGEQPAGSGDAGGRLCTNCGERPRGTNSTVCQPCFNFPNRFRRQAAS